MTNRKLIKSTGIIGFATGTSRILGFVRDIIFARMFGTGIFSQAFVVAFRLPNMLRDMIGEGATDAAIVPVLSEYRHTQSKEEYWQAARVIWNLMVLILAVLSICGIVFAPILVRIIAPGFIEDPEKFSTTVWLTRMLFPYIFFLGLVAYSKGVLSSFNYFVTPAFAQVILNITMILALYFLCGKMGINGLIFGVLTGGFFQVLLQLKPLISRGFNFKMPLQFAHPAAKKIGKLLIPRLFGTAVYQISVFVDTILASLGGIVGAGGVAGLYFANRLVHLPLAVFGIALATAALPRMSREAAEKDMDKLKNTISFSLNFVFTVMVPCAFGLMILANPIIRIIFQGGEFTSYSTRITSNALVYYAIGLFAYAGIKILVSAYYAMGDTRTPVKTASISLLINLVLNLILMWPLKLGGLALATSVAAISNFISLYVILVRRIGDMGSKKMFISFMKVCAASVVMAIFTIFARWVMAQFKNPTRPVEIMSLLTVILIGVCSYLLAAYIVRIKEIRRLWTIILSKIR
ncbi:MAG: murein biosynthesis integral membrane protein MurJ [Candidatus Omnitrophota bacterium]